MTIDNAKRAADLLGIDRTIKVSDREGIVTMRMGNGSTEARVYAPTNSRSAERNLNFAIANLAAYLDWDKRAAERVKADAEAEKDRLEIERRALAAYNDQTGSKHTYWTQAFYPHRLDQDVVDAWSKLVRHIDASAPKPTAPEPKRADTSVSLNIRPTMDAFMRTTRF